MTKPSVFKIFFSSYLSSSLVACFDRLTCGGLPARTCPSVARPSSNLKDNLLTLMIHNLDEPEDMNGLSVAAAGEEGPAGGEGEGEDGGGSLQSAS